MNNRNRKEYENGTNRSSYNKIRKEYLAEQCDIRCSYCGWNSGENSSDKWYGSRHSWGSNEIDFIKHPSWKLATKNRKQWQEKPKSYRIKEKYSSSRRYYYCEILF